MPFTEKKIISIKKSKIVFFIRLSVKFVFSIVSTVKIFYWIGKNAFTEKKNNLHKKMIFRKTKKVLFWIISIKFVSSDFKYCKSIYQNGWVILLVNFLLKIYICFFFN